MSQLKYSAIVFDLGNVLIPFDYTPAIIKLNQIQSGLGDKFSEFYKANYSLHRDFERGNITETTFINTMLEVVDYKMEPEIFCRIFSDIFYFK